MFLLTRTSGAGWTIARLYATAEALPERALNLRCQTTYNRIKKDMGTKRITCPVIVSDSNIDRFVKIYNSKLETNDKLIFSMQKARFISVYQLSRLFCWFNKIKEELNCEVTVKLPYDVTDPQNELPIHSFFDSWNVYEALKHIEVKVPDPTLKLITSKPNQKKNTYRQYVPFEFYSSLDSYENFLDTLSKPENMTKAFQDTATVNMVGSGGIRSIILQEIGKNAFEHGNGKIAHITIGIIPKVTHYSQKNELLKAQKRAESVPDYAKNFFLNIGSNACLEIVISDAGDGIYDTLIDSYLNDTVIEGKKKFPSHSDIIDYAFLLHSSSKNKSYYKNEPQKNGNGVGYEYQSPRGLYFVKNISRRNNALLVCRSRSGLVAWDFYNSKSGEIHNKKNKKPLNHFDELPDFGGTQLQIIIPIKERKIITQYSVDVVKKSFIHTATNLKPRIIPLASLVDTKNSSPSSKSYSRDVVTGIHRIMSNKPLGKFIIFDFLGTKWSKDSLYPVMCEMGHLSLDNNIIFLLHTQHLDGILEEMLIQEEGSKKIPNYYILKFRPFVKVITGSASIEYDFIGLPKNIFKGIETFKFNSLLSNLKTTKEYEVLDHIVQRTEEGKNLIYFNLKDVSQKINEWRHKIIKNMIIEPRFGIKHEGYFLLPSSVYVQDFYEVGALLDYPDATQLVSDFFINFFRSYADVHCIIFLSEIGKKLQMKLSSYNALPDIINFCVLKTTDALRLKFGKKVEKLVIIVDVIATGKSLSKYISIIEKKLPHAQISILTVIDIRVKEASKRFLEVRGKEHLIKSFFRLPSKFSDVKPSSWSWDSIRRIDENTWRPIKETEIKEELWTIDEFLAKACNELSSVRLGHYYSNNGNHYRLFFSTIDMITSYKNEILNKINEYINRLVIKSNNGFVSHIIYPKDSLGMESLAESLSRKVNGFPKIIPVDRFSSPQSYKLKTETTDIVVALDTATSSARTISLLVEVADSLNANCTLICLMLSRASQLSWSFIHKITGYNNRDIVIKALSRIQIPAFESTFACPLCDKTRFLTKMKTSKKYRSFDQYIKKELDRLKEEHISIHLVDKTHGIQSYDMQNLVKFRLLLELCKENLSSLEELERILKDAQVPFEVKESLFLSCRDEASVIFNHNSTFPHDWRSLFYDVAKNVNLNSQNNEVIAATLEVLSTSDRLDFLNHIITFSRKFASEEDKIEILIIELLILIERDPKIEGYLFKTIERIYNFFISEKIASAKVLSQISKLKRQLKFTQSKTDLDIDSAINAYKRIIQLLEDRRGLTHPRIGECLLKINMISTPQNAKIMIGRYFEEPNSLKDIMDNSLIPCLAILDEAIDTLDDDRKKYVTEEKEQSLKDDFQVLHDTINAFMLPANERLYGEHSFNLIFENAAYTNALRRLTYYLGNSDKRLLKLLKTLQCDAKKELELLTKPWEQLAKQNNISMECRIPDNETSIFIASISFNSLMDSIIKNSFDWAFSKESSKNQCIFMDFENGSDDFFSVIISDNGGGIKKRKEAVLARLSEISRVFSGNAEFADSQQFSTSVKLSFRKI